MPIDRLGVVLLHALANAILIAQVALRFRIAVVGSSVIPLDRPGAVLLRALVIIINDT